MILFARFFFVVSTFLFALSALAAPTVVRWTGAEDKTIDIPAIVERIRAKTGFELKVEDLKLVEDRQLANTYYRMWFQTVDGLPVRERSIRVWSNDAREAVQVEAYLDDPAKLEKALALRERVGLDTEALVEGASNELTLSLVRKAVRENEKFSSDGLVRDVQWSDAWEGGKLVRVVTAKGKRGTHHVTISLDTRKIASSRYEEFPQFGAQPNSDQEFSIPALVYPIYEQADGVPNVQERVTAELKYIKKTRPSTLTDPYESLRTRQYLESQYDAVKGETEAGRALGFWAMSYIKRQVAELRSALPMVDNGFSGGAILDGRYATISFHPNAKEKFNGLKFNLLPSVQFKPEWRSTVVEGQDVWEMVPLASLLGRPLHTENEALLRPARRLVDHNPVEYINDGFDEVQVYYAINALVDSLQGMGFTDPELSTRPWNAFLYDPDIAMRDNAYYTDDTINFTTYSPSAPNYARDNSTIWHELGHGIMDRLMGDYVRLADTGGLSEGMADFLAALVIADVSKNQPFDGSDKFRIINKTGFFLTNEVHDDGEAYGGAMKDLLDAAIARDGQVGVTKVTDLTLEAMRLCRNHPALTAQEWFAHMLFADELGRSGLRAPGELGALILGALAGRNFSMTGGVAADFVLKNGEEVVTDTGLGSRRKPIPITLPADGKATYDLSISLKSTDTYRFEYPVKVKVYLRTGPLQGAIKWDGEENTVLEYVLEKEGDTLPVALTANGTCDEVNRDDGSCVDFAYLQAFNRGSEMHPVAKKRFYLRVKTQ